MRPRLWLASLALLALLVVSLISLTAAADSQQGGFGAEQTRRSATRLQADAAVYWKFSQQDGRAVVSLWNNAEAMGLCRAAQTLLLQAGLPVPPDLLDLAASLQEDRDDLLERLPPSLQP